MGKQIRFWSKWLTKTKLACYSLIFLKVLYVLGIFGLSWKPWMLLTSHCALLICLQCKVERWKKEIPDLHTMLQNTCFYHAQISGEVSHQSDTNTDSQMCNLDQSNNENRLWFTTACNNKQSISKDPLKTHFLCRNLHGFIILVSNFKAFLSFL